MAQPFKQNYIPVVHTLLAWHTHSNKIIFLQFTLFWHGATIQTKLYSCSSHSSGMAQPFIQNYIPAVYTLLAWHNHSKNYVPAVHTLLAWHNHSNKIIFL
jgi:hypothetical protein